MLVELPAFGRSSFVIACLLLMPRRRRWRRRAAPSAAAAPPTGPETEAPISVFPAGVTVKPAADVAVAWMTDTTSHVYASLGVEERLREWGERLAKLAIAAAVAPGAAFLLFKIATGAGGRARRGRPWALVVCALREEAAQMEALLEGVRAVGTTPATTHVARTERTSGFLRGLRVDVLTCGVGEVDAAIAVAALLAGERGNPPAAIISVGCAGAHREDLRAGDVGASAGRARFAGWRPGRRLTDGPRRPPPLRQSSARRSCPRP